MRKNSSPPFRNLALSHLGNTSSPQHIVEKMYAWVDYAVERKGADAILIRENWLPDEWADRVYRLNRKFAGRRFSILINGAYDPTWPVEGLHFKEAVDTDIRFLAQRFWVGKSVHSLEAARAAERAGYHYVCFSPVFATLSHPGEPAQGIGRLADVCIGVSIPVYALGGISEDNREICLNNGAYGTVALGMFQMF